MSKNGAGVDPDIEDVPPDFGYDECSCEDGFTCPMHEAEDPDEDDDSFF